MVDLQKIKRESDQEANSAVDLRNYHFVWLTDVAQAPSLIPVQGP